jgi:hypothetical protein
MSMLKEIQVGKDFYFSHSAEADNFVRLLTWIDECRAIIAKQKLVNPRIEVENDRDDYSYDPEFSIYASREETTAEKKERLHIEKRREDMKKEMERRQYEMLKEKVERGEI